MKATVQVDKSRLPKNVSMFDGIDTIEITREELFKFGIFKEEIAPNHVHETDLDYLLSKIPAYDMLYSDFVKLNSNQIINASTDDRKMKDISEVIGIALGLKLTIAALKINQSQIEKIPPPAIKEKYLDYKVVHKNRKYEIETKGTTQGSIERFVTDITDKKKNKPKVYFRFGTVAQICKPGSKNNAVLHVCDDPPQEVTSSSDSNAASRHYFSPLSFILDNKYYNKLVKYHAGETRKRIRYSADLFFGKYKFDGDTYYGDYFDRRLILDSLLPLAKETRSIEKLFGKITKKQGKYKIFIGISSRVLPLLFDKGRGGDIAQITFKEVQIEHGSSIVFRDTDGVLIAKSIGERDHQIEKIFTENEVKKRIGFYDNYLNHTPAKCGAPCRSKGRQGKTCEIKTYRGHCHFHRS